MHRIQYYKINEQIVWDRTKKLDILTGGDQLNEASNALIYTPQRYQSILETLKSLLPDFICLQEVTVNFLNLLLNETWLQENNYYIIITKKVIDSNKKKSYGQMMIMKNFRLRSFSICPLDLSDDDHEATAKKSKTMKTIIIARFGINTKITIDLVNLHLHSDHSPNASERRCQALENSFRKIKTNNCMFIGDFNFGDNNLKEQNILATYEDEIHDLWKDIYHLDQ
ncbi:unnamed protein product, partial [Rotaria sp. Silwood2]